MHGAFRARADPSPPEHGTILQVELLSSALVHAGPVISLAFSASSTQLFTTSLDGTVFGLALEGVQQDPGAKRLPVPSTLEVSASVVFAEAHAPEVALGGQGAPRGDRVPRGA